MNLLDQIAEARIQEAIERGDLRDLPGAGQPLVLDDDSAVPEVLRAAYRLLKNAGFLLPNCNCARKSVKPSSSCNSYRQVNAAARAPVLERLQLRLAAARRQPSNLLLEDQYRQRLLERLEPTERPSP